MFDKQTFCRSTSAIVYWRLGVFLLAFIFLAPKMIAPGITVFFILGVVVLSCILKDMVILFVSYRNGQRWKDLTTCLELTPSVANKIVPIRSDLVDQSFRLVVPPEPPTSLVGKVLGQFLLSTLNVLLGIVTVVLVNSLFKFGGNWLTIIAFIMGFCVLVLITKRIHLFVLASTRSTYYRKSKASSVPNVGFFQCHVNALQLLGFECSDGLYEDQTKKRIAVAISPDQPTWAELSFVRESPSFWKTSFQFKSLMNDGELVTTETYPCEKLGPKFMCDALHKHNVEVERYCLVNQAKAAVIAADETLAVYRYLAFTGKIKQQELVSGSADSVLSDWDWFPSWLRAPVVKFS